MLARTALCCLCLAAATAAHADEIADRLCPILEDIAAGSAGKADYAIQAELVMQIGGAYDFDGEKLREVTRSLDASATEGCPEARSTILERVNMGSLESAVR